MRNLLWLGFILCLEATGAWLDTTAVPSSDFTAGVRVEQFPSFTWKERDPLRGQVFVFSSGANNIQAYLKAENLPADKRAEVQIVESIVLDQNWSSQWLNQLGQEVAQAAKEPCRGQKMQELSWAQGSDNLLLEIGSSPGPGQRRIIALIEGSSIVDYRNQCILSLALNSDSLSRCQF